MLAELDVHHSRPIAPTRRVALGDAWLPVDPAPGFGGILLGGIVAGHASDIDPDLRGELAILIADLEEGRSVAQPRLRYRFQTDRVGLIRSRFRLVGVGDEVEFDFDVRCSPAQCVLGALYAAGRLELPARLVVMAAIQRALFWRGSLDQRLVHHLAEGRLAPNVPVSWLADPQSWALETLGLAKATTGHTEVQRRFRALLRQAHPDHGGATDGAAHRIAELTEARRILLATMGGPLAGAES